MPLPESMPVSHCLLGMPTISAPIGDPQSNRNPQLPSGGYLSSTTMGLTPLPNICPTWQVLGAPTRERPSWEGEA